MRNVTSLLLVTLAAAAASACQKDNSDQNIIVDNNVAANADIDVVPPDESSVTPSEELANGADNPDVNSAGNRD